MTYSDRDPYRESRRAGDDAAIAGGEFVLGSDGRPITDRYGRPVRRRQASGSSSGRRSSPSAGARRAPRREETRFDPAPGAGFGAGARAGAGSGTSASAAPRAGGRYPRAPYPAGYAPAHGGEAYRRRASEVPRTYRPPARAQRPHRRRKRVNPLRRGLGCFGWLIAIFLVFLLAFSLWADSRLTRVDAQPAEPVANTAGTNWLLVGSDSRQGLTEEQQNILGTGGDVGVGRTDTIMLLHIPRSGKARLVSIPRDSYVEVPGFGSDKINAAFTYGGPQLLTQTVENVTGLHIDHYAEIGMGGLANVVDSVGGVDLCVQEAIDDPLAGISLQPGCQRLDGPTALGYVRTRATALGDLDRVQRQREFFAALLHKITSPATLANPFRAISLVGHTSGSFIVGSDDHVWHLARVALAMGSGVETETVPIGGFADTEVGNVVLWDDAGAPQLWESLW